MTSSQGDRDRHQPFPKYLKRQRRSVRVACSPLRSKKLTSATIDSSCSPFLGSKHTRRIEAIKQVLGEAMLLTMAARKIGKQLGLVEGDERLLSAQQEQHAHLQQACSWLLNVAHMTYVASWAAGRLGGRLEV